RVQPDHPDLHRGLARSLQSRVSTTCALLPQPTRLRVLVGQTTACLCSSHDVGLWERQESIRVSSDPASTGPQRLQPNGSPPSCADDPKHPYPPTRRFCRPIRYTLSTDEFRSIRSEEHTSELQSRFDL